MTWTVLVHDTVCGGCQKPIRSGAPVALVTTRQLQRCETCAGAMGFAVDARELDLERFRLEQERLRRDTPPPTVVDSPRPRRMQPPRPVVAFSSLGDLATTFDPRAAAAGDREDR